MSSKDTYLSFIAVTFKILFEVILYLEKNYKIRNITSIARIKQNNTVPDM